MRKPVACAMLVLLTGVVSLFAADIEPNWGTAATSFKTIDQSAFMTAGGAAVLNATRSRECVQGFGQCKLIASIDLPSGALITGYSAEACRLDPAVGLRFMVHKRSMTSSEDVLIGPLGNASSTGCLRFAATVNPGYTVDNANYALYAEVQMDEPVMGQSFTQFGVFRVFYKLQVSPAPGTATFSDVPTSHLFFQYIEALAASGITAGCTAPPNPNYCPDAPVTRGQMAVFLSRALGLHFPN